MLAVDLPKQVIRTVFAVLDTYGRDVSARPDRRYIQLRGLDSPRAAQLVAVVERDLQRHQGVRWASVNAPTRRVIVCLGAPCPGPLGWAIAGSTTVIAPAAGAVLPRLGGERR